MQILLKPPNQDNQRGEINRTNDRKHKCTMCFSAEVHNREGQENEPQCRAKNDARNPKYRLYEVVLFLLQFEGKKLDAPLQGCKNAVNELFSLELQEEK